MSTAPASWSRWPTRSPRWRPASAPVRCPGEVPPLVAVEADLVAAARRLGEALEVLVAQGRLDVDDVGVGRRLVGCAQFAVGRDGAVERRRLALGADAADHGAVILD